MEVRKDQDALTEIKINNDNSGTSINHTRLGFYDGATLRGFAEVNNNTDLFLLGQNSATGQVAIYSGSTEKVRINSTGNVGIGTNAPSAPLELMRSGSEPYFQITRYQTGEGGGI